MAELITGFTIWAQAMPLYSLIVISFVITLLTTIAYKYFSDQKAIKFLKDEIKSLSDQMKELKDNPQKMMEKQKELMEKNLKMMKYSLKPSLYTAIPLIAIFYFIRNIYEDSGAIIFSLTWIWIYIILSIVFSIILRKVLKVH
ncbi:hypothetical protein CL617_04355 [archaeon]|nr:hypothetical protein [archaeon]|tara:strand:+ start:6784 stop:7212 length:429 start_codon:yes stop_codon:yes gene_type:complete